jgi:hypothetical protein
MVICRPSAAASLPTAKRGSYGQTRQQRMSAGAQLLCRFAHMMAAHVRACASSRCHADRANDWFAKLVCDVLVHSCGQT